MAVQARRSVSLVMGAINENNINDPGGIMKVIRSARKRSFLCKILLILGFVTFPLLCAGNIRVLSKSTLEIINIGVYEGTPRWGYSLTQATHEFFADYGTTFGFAMIPKGNLDQERITLSIKAIPPYGSDFLGFPEHALTKICKPDQLMPVLFTLNTRA
jgi:hypothetical protein